MPAKVISKSTRISRMGSSQTYYTVECECGKINIFYALSWGGHGKLKCKGCGAKIYKRETLERANTTSTATGGHVAPDEITPDGQRLYYARPRRVK